MSGTLVAASNLGGGIARHLELTTRGAPAPELLELPESLSLREKAQRLRERARATGVTRVVTHGVAAGLAARHRGRGLAQVRHAEFWHADPFFLAPRNRHAYRLLARTGRAPQEQVFVNSFLIGTYGDRRSRHVVVPNTVPVPEPGPAPQGEQPGRTAVFVGRLSPEKGYEDLLESWDAAWVRSGWRLRVVGDGPLADRALPDGVERLGHVADPLPLMAQADLLVVPSWTETGPYVALEAMALGRPFLGTSVGDMPALVDAAGCGLLVPPRDTAALRAGLAEGLGAPRAEIEARGERGRRWLVEHRPFEAWQAAVGEFYAP